MLKAILVGFLFAVFAVFVVGLVEEQTRRERDAMERAVSAVLSDSSPQVLARRGVERERDAFSAMERAVRAAGRDSSPRVLAEARRAIERAFSAFEGQEKRRARAKMAFEGLLRHGDFAGAVRAQARYVELLRLAFAPSPVAARGVHNRYVYAAGDAFLDAANGVEGVAAGVVGFDVHHRSDLQRLASARLAWIWEPGRMFCESSRGSEWACFREAGLDVLRALASATVDVARGLESYGEEHDPGSLRPADEEER